MLAAHLVVVAEMAASEMSTEVELGAEASEDNMVEAGPGVQMSEVVSEVAVIPFRSQTGQELEGLLLGSICVYTLLTASLQG